MSNSVKQQAALDIVLVIATAVIVQTIAHQFFWKYASLFAAASVFILSTFLLRLRNMSWKDLGFIWPQTKWGVVITIAQAILAMIVVMVAGAFLAIWLDQFLTRPLGEGDRFAGMTGNIPLFAFWLTMGWVVGGFIEEMVFRGFLINRVESLLSGKTLAQGIKLISLMAVIIPAILFGGAHYYYRGLHGAIVIGAVGVMFGLFYLLFGRRLWPLIIAHGTFDTLGITAEFLDADW